MTDHSPIHLAGFPVKSTTQANLTEYVLSRINASQKSVLFFANTNFIVQCREYLVQMLNDDVIIVNDGIGMDIACLLIHHKRFVANLNGTDFTPYLFSSAGVSFNVFLLGGKRTVLDKAAHHLVHVLGQKVAGSFDGYGDMTRDDLVEIINQSKAEIVLVAMGNPKQEQWILNHYKELDAKLISGVGALFDFWAGDKPRAPMFIQRIRLEWFYRLCLEPKRLFKRYTIDIVKFLIICIKYRKYHL